MGGGGGGGVEKGQNNIKEGQKVGKDNRGEKVDEKRRKRKAGTKKVIRAQREGKREQDKGEKSDTKTKGNER